MRPLTFAEILLVWEQGWDRPLVDRALLLLKAAQQNRSLAELEEMNIGARDAELVRLRERTFGEKFVCRSQCMKCCEELEFQLDGLENRFGAEEPSRELRADISGVQVRYRVPSSLYIRAALEWRDAGGAFRHLIQRCILSARRNDELVRVEELSEEMLDEIQERMAQADPNADVRIEIVCPECGNHSNFPFDIVTYFWSELEAQAKRQLWEVHVLAGAYGWSEAEILEMSPFRRSLYVEMAQG